MFITAILVEITHIIDIAPCSIAPCIFFLFVITIILNVDSVFSIILNENISIYVIIFILLPLFYYV